MDPLQPQQPAFNPAEIGALAHLYRGELYRSKMWRARLDTTTNWAVGTTGVTVSIAFGTPEATPLPLLVISLLVTVFLGIEARRYRYFDIWRARVRVLEVGLMSPILRGEGASVRTGWNQLLAENYENLQFNISYIEAVGRRLRRNYIWIYLILGLTYFTKLLIHPHVVRSLGEVLERAAIGPISGGIVMAFVLLWHVVITVFAIATTAKQEALGRVARPDKDDEDRLLRSRLKI